jgi:hypothetical protein
MPGGRADWLFQVTELRWSTFQWRLGLVSGVYSVGPIPRSRRAAPHACPRPLPLPLSLVLLRAVDIKQAPRDTLGRIGPGILWVVRDQLEVAQVLGTSDLVFLRRDLRRRTDIPAGEESPHNNFALECERPPRAVKAPTAGKMQSRKPRPPRPTASRSRRSRFAAEPRAPSTVFTIPTCTSATQHACQHSVA